MNQKYIGLILPEHHPIATIGPNMSLEEETAREKTLTTVLSVISKEAGHLMEREGTAAYAQAISQAWGYTETMLTRRGFRDHTNPDRPGASLLSACLAAQKAIASQEAENIDAVDATLSDELTEDEERDTLSHGAAAALIGAHAAIREHVRGIAAKDEMSAGHAQAAVGLKVTIDHLVETLELQHEEHCHHCDTIDRAHEGAEASDTLMTTMLPAIRELTQVQVHPSLLRKDETGDESGDETKNEDETEAQILAESTIDLFASFQLLFQGDPADPERSLHAFYLDGTLHVKRLTDPFPMGMPLLGASAIAEQTRALAIAHAQDHAEGFADLVAERTYEMELEADCALHTATQEEINHYLETLADATPHPATQADAVSALTGHRTLAEKFMGRRPDLFPPATPAQQGSVMDAVREANLPPEMENLIDEFLQMGAAALNQRPEPAPIGKTILLMEAATGLTEDEEKLIDIAESLGRPTPRDKSAREWVDQFIQDTT